MCYSIHNDDPSQYVMLDSTFQTSMFGWGVEKFYWSWDRILRSPFIKQADTLQGMYLFEEQYDRETLQRHFDFYEARTVHESSLSPCIHAVFAAHLGMMDKAYALYLRTSRLDLDDYNHEVDEGLHITSMGGSWLAIIEGFGGKRVVNGKLSLNPQIPSGWKRYAFRLLWKDQPVEVSVTRDGVQILYRGTAPVTIAVWGKDHALVPNVMLKLPREQGHLVQAWCRSTAFSGGESLIFAMTAGLCGRVASPRLCVLPLCPIDMPYLGRRAPYGKWKRR